MVLCHAELTWPGINGTYCSLLPKPSYFNSVLLLRNKLSSESAFHFPSFYRTQFFSESSGTLLPFLLQSTHSFPSEPVSILFMSQCNFQTNAISLPKSQPPSLMLRPFGCPIYHNLSCSITIKSQCLHVSVSSGSWLIAMFSIPYLIVQVTSFLLPTHFKVSPVVIIFT